MGKVLKKVFSIRLDPAIVDAIKQRGFTLSEVIEQALKDWLSRH